ncbi:MAG: hypothetical protein LBD75_02865 [Candidatus Peribacteria bacterium]|nr:hypothetical protein [Candidatus Peribacteria bacterium]
MKEKLARIGCYDEKNHTILYESQSIDWSTRTYQRIISQFSTKKTNEILENAITKKPIDIILYVPEYEGIIQD